MAPSRCGVLLFRGGQSHNGILGQAFTAPIDKRRYMTLASLEQDKASGGVDRRKMRGKTGEIFTVSLAVNGTKSPFRVILRFKTGGYTVQRSVGIIEAQSKFEALKMGWVKVRTDKIVEQDGWSWVNP